MTTTRRTAMGVLLVLFVFGVVVYAMQKRPADSAATAAVSPRLHVVSKNPLQAGKYLVLIAGCNDCHTAGWDRHPNDIPMNKWLMGKSVGFRGPWGVSYPGNLRRLMATMPTSAAWIHFVRHWHAMPPMPIMNLRDMSNADLKAIYAFVRTLKPLGKAAPTSLSPGQTPTTPYIDEVPRKPK